MESDPIGGILGAALGAVAELLEPGTQAVEINAAAPAEHRALRLSARNGGIDIHPGQLRDAAIVAGPGGDLALQLAFDPDVAGWLATATQDGVGQPMEMAICGEVLFAPVVREPILGGKVMISGSFTAEELAAVMAIVAGRFDCQGRPLSGPDAPPAQATANPRSGSTRP